MELPKPPDDPDLKNIIDRLANFVARNGPEFEQMTKQKQKDNPRFSFLHGGEHFAYYQYKLSTEHASSIISQTPKLVPPQQQSLTPPMPGILPQTIPPPSIQPPWQSVALPPALQSAIPPPVVQPTIAPTIPPPTVITNISLAQPVPTGVSSVVQAIQLPSIPQQQPPQQQPQQQQPQQQPPAILQQQIQTLEKQIEAQEIDAKTQIKQSEQNLSAQFKSLNQRQQAQIEDAILKAREEHLGSLSAECEIGTEDFDKVVQPIIDSCTKDAILSGKTWIFNNCISESHCNLAAQYLLMRITAKESTFDMKLHLIYLINDLLHHCQRKNADGLKKALEKVVVPIFCSTSAGIDEDRMNKLTKLLSLWEQNKYFAEQTREKMKEPSKALSEYQAELLHEHKDKVTQITSGIQQRYNQLQKQHKEFADHLNLQITQGKAQLEVMKEQVPDTTPAVVPSLPMPTTKAPSETGNSRSSTPINDSPIEEKESSDEEPIRSPEQEREKPFDSPEFTPKSSNLSGPSPFSQSSSSGRPPRGQQSSLGSGPPFDHSFDQSFDQSYDPAFDHFPPDHYPDHFMPHDQPPHPRFGGPRPPGFGRMPHPMEYEYGHGPPRHGMFRPDFRGPPGPGPNHMQMPDLSKPPPGFPPPGPHHFGPPPPDLDLTPAMPYFDLPAGLMVPLVKLEDNEYQPLDPRDIRLPPPMPPSERLLAAVEAFYSPPIHDRPRDAEGWEKMSLYEYYRAKQRALQEKLERERVNGRPFNRNASPPPDSSPRGANNSMSRSVSHSRSPSRSRSRSRSGSPFGRRQRRHSRSRSRSSSRSQSRSRSRSRSQSRSDSRSRSTSRSPRRRRRDRGYSRSRSRSKTPPPVRRPARPKSESPLPYLRSSKSRSPSPAAGPIPFRRSRSRSITPPSFGADGSVSKESGTSKLGLDNKGHQLMMKMGWGGKGLGATEQGIVEPISAADVRDKQDMHKGIGVNLKDPFEQFRKNKSAGFIQRMKARDEMREAKSQMIKQQAGQGSKGK